MMTAHACATPLAAIASLTRKISCGIMVSPCKRALEKLHVKWLHGHGCMDSLHARVASCKGAFLKAPFVKSAFTRSNLGVKSLHATMPCNHLAVA